MKKSIIAFILLASISLMGCTSNKNTSDQNQQGGGSTGGNGGQTPGPSDPVKANVDKHTLSDTNPPIDINSEGQNVTKAVWDSFKGASASKFVNHYNYTYRYYVSGNTTYESFTKDGYELSNNTGVYYYERINGKQYTYSYNDGGYQRITSSYDFISHRSEVLAHEVFVHMFDYELYEYSADLGGFFLYNTSAFSTMVKFQGGYLTYLRYTLNSPMATYEIYNSFETTIEIPKSYYYK